MLPELSLVFQTERKTSLRFPLRPGVHRVGRAADCDIHLMHMSISRVHAVITHSGATIRVADLGSRNGTFVNHERVQESPLKVGDFVSFGHARCEIVDIAQGDTNRRIASDSTIGPLRDSKDLFPIGKLSQAQLKVFWLLLEAKREREIAEELHLSQHTVHNHARKIFEVLEVTNKAELIKTYGSLR